MPIPLRSVSAAILDRLPPGPFLGWTILSVHRRACNLRSPQGVLLGLVNPELGNGPFHAVLAQPADHAWLAQGLVQGRLTLDVAGATAWDPWLGRWKVEDGRRKTGKGGGRDLTPPLAPPPVEREEGRPRRWQGEGRGAQSPNPLAQALRAGDPERLQETVRALAGRGPGLTPAGDDFLLGLMAGLWLFPEQLNPRWTVPEVCQRIAELAVPRTTTLSGAWLRWAGQGAFSQPWHALAQALAADDPPQLARAVDAILAVGATSGQDALAGFAAWVEGQASPATPSPSAAP